MFDLFGLQKVDAKDAVREMMHGATLGLLDGYEWRLREKDDEIKTLNKQVSELTEEKRELERALAAQRQAGATQ